jgi:predicted AAA+ superfamily ATPase
MIERRYRAHLRRLLGSFPIVTILGPRQCGKTTFVRSALPAWTYLDLERPAVAAAFEADPEGRFRQLGDRLVLDEAQRCPSIFPVLRGLVDARRARGCRFVLLGSASPTLVRGISESLAGRTAFLDLAPLRWDEVARVTEDLGVSWFRGGYPTPFLEHDDRIRAEWFEASDLLTASKGLRSAPPSGTSGSSHICRMPQARRTTKFWHGNEDVEGGQGQSEVGSPGLRRRGGDRESWPAHDLLSGG